MKSPFFTAIIATYNRAEMLREAMQSVLSQTFQDFELIVVDDQSSDNTKETVMSINDSRLQYIVNDHLKGNSGARNAGIARARGAWVAFLDDDDTWFRDKLELVHEKICTIDESVGLIYTGFAYYNFDIGKQISTHIPEKRGWIQTDLIVDNYVGTPSAVCVRTDILKEIEGFDERINHFEDGELYVRVAGLSKVDFVEEVLTNYRTSNNDKLSISLEKGLMSFDLFWDKHREIIDKSPRLRHLAASRVFRFAVKKRSMPHIIKSLPWTLAGIFYDIHNLQLILKMVVADIFKRDRRGKML